MPLLSWLTRDKDLRAADRVPYRLLDEVSELSHGDGDQGLLVQGDNLEALKALLPFYAGRVKCIYIDPPYNTRSAFGHYDDSLEHSKWLAMIVPRLMLLREFLSEDGSIWVSIDDNEGHYLKVVMDEIFGRRNFISSICWQSRYSVSSDAVISNSHNTIHLYAKSPDVWKHVRNRTLRSERQAKQYKNPDDDPRGPWRAIPWDAPNVRENLSYEIVTPTGRGRRPPAGRCWSRTQAQWQEIVDNGLAFFGKSGDGAPSFKRFLRDDPGVVPTTWWEHEDAGHTDEASKEVRKIFGSGNVFDTPKPERLIQRILHISTNPGDLVLDSFLGSGTTAAVAHKMGRRWIGIEMGEHARTHCALRLQKVIAGEEGGISKDVGWTGGGGFRFCRLGHAVYNAEGRIDDAIRFADLARHVWFSETRQPLGSVPDSPLLGTHKGRAVALLYNGILKDRTPQGGNVLTRPVLRLLKDALPGGFDGDLVVYGTACRLSADTLKQEGILFRQTPYDIAVRV